jgi:phosphoribosylaminoimidazole-succinocarboxamide synthase
MNEAITGTRLEGLTPFRQGKVRDLYEVDGQLLIVATDRISAFDYILASGIPDKGAVLNQLSAFWFGLMADIVPNHVIATDPAEYPEPARRHARILRGRSMLVRRTRPLPIECVVRGYLSGSGWKEYQKTGRVCGIPLPPGLRESDRLPEPIFTPSTKAESGHDVNITQGEAADIVGAAIADQLRDLSLTVYGRGARHAEALGIIVADTKFEFGLFDTPGRPASLMLIDEVLTPDSSRFWPADAYAPGGPQPSYDKQYVRDYLEQIGWNKQPPAPALPPEVVARTREKYVEAFRRLTGRELA